MAVTAERHGGAVTVRLHEPSLAHDLAVLRSQLAECMLRGRGGVTIDLSDVGRISSPTVAALLWARRSCAARRLPFAVTGCASQNQGVLRTCGLLSTPAVGESAW